MRTRVSVFALVAITCLAATVTNAQEQVLPAGTLFQCTVDEPDLSSRMLKVGDPVLCALGPVGLFGRSVFPRGAYLAGSFKAYRNPGHLAGKGWMEVAFDRLIIPGEAIPVPAKVIAVPHFRVDVEGRIHGGGHPKRDAFGWMLPPLWPVKLATLPMRGPRPELRGENRITLRLMDDVVLPMPARVPRITVSNQPRLPSQGPTVPGDSSYERVTASNQRSASTFSSVPVKLQYSGMDIPAAGAVTMPALRQREPVDRGRGALGQASDLTLLVLKDGAAYVAKDYWLEETRLRYLAPDGTSRLLPLASLDLPMTVELNRQRGVRLVLRSETEEQ